MNVYSNWGNVPDDLKTESKWLSLGRKIVDYDKKVDIKVKNCIGKKVHKVYPIEATEIKIKMIQSWKKQPSYLKTKTQWLNEGRDVKEDAKGIVMKVKEINGQYVYKKYTFYEIHETVKRYSSLEEIDDKLYIVKDELEDSDLGKKFFEAKIKINGFWKSKFIISKN